jgi:hypothetical protein
VADVQLVIPRFGWQRDRGPAVIAGHAVQRGAAFQHEPVGTGRNRQAQRPAGIARCQRRQAARATQRREAVADIRIAVGGQAQSGENRPDRIVADLVPLAVNVFPVQRQPGFLG